MQLYLMSIRVQKVCAVCLQILHRTIVENGGPANLITMQREPDMEAVNKLTASPKIRLMVGTGGMGMVNALLKSGKKQSVQEPETHPL